VSHEQDVTISVQSLPVELHVNPATISVRIYYSRYHLPAAAYFAQRAARCERIYQRRKETPNIFLRHRAYVIGSLTSSIAFLESTINEVFLDARLERDGGVTRALPHDIRKQISNCDYGQKPILDKYRIAARATNRKIDKRNRRYVNVTFLNHVRNLVVHAHPETFSVGPSGLNYRQDDTLEKMERQDLFSLNPMFVNSGNPYFPDKCLSHGCAEWAVRTSLDFADWFFELTGMQPPYTDIKPTLMTR
jgi:hypothetical protein